MNPYLAFSFDNYYPQGGMNDFAGAFATLDEAKEALAGRGGDVQQIVGPDGVVSERSRIDWSGVYSDWIADL